MAIEITSLVSEINPNTITQEGFELLDQNLIPNSTITTSFSPSQDLVEFWVYDINNNLLTGDEDFKDYILSPSPSSAPGTSGELGDVSELELNPSEDTINLGFDVGTINTVYNFITYKLGTSQDIQYYVSEISSDRTELRLNTNFIINETIQAEYLQFRDEIDANIYVDEFYLNFGDNQYQTCINSQLDTSAKQYSILIKLYDALPPNFSLKDEVSVVVKPAESVAYQVVHPPLENIDLSQVTYLQGPNTNLSINEFLNNSTDLQSQDNLLNTVSTSSANNLSNVLNQKGISLTPNYSYSTFNEFVNFSSAQKRIENFVEKVSQIQSYEADIETLNTISGPTSSSIQVSSSVAVASNSIENLIKNFDGYEYFLYYSSGSSTYPKTGSAQPYELLPTTDSTVLTWLGSDVENSQYYGGISLSASLFDNTNQNWLYYTIPEFIRDNGDNNQYLEFSNMVGQHFDEIWLYTRAVTEKLNTTSQLSDGVPLDLADDVIASLGYDGFGSNFNNQDPYIGLIGENNGVYVPPTGSELINSYIAVNNGQVVNFWDDGYSFENYVQQLNDPGYPYAIDKVSKEIFKRLYHNMSYLVKKKGTISGLRQLINIWGIPNTILRINEFGGKNKDNTDDYDLWYNRYSYAFTPIANQNVASASVAFPWMPLERNRIADSEYIVPDNIQFRFKTTGYPSSSFAGEFFTQSLAVKKSDGDDTSTEFDFGISLLYEPVVTGSYSGSDSSEYENWGKMRFYMSGAAADGGVATSNDIYLPFYDKGWWSVMLQRNQHVSSSDNTVDTTYTLYAKNKIYNGNDGNSIGFEGSASISSSVVGVPSQSLNESWNKFGVAERIDGIYLGGFISGSTVGGITTGLPGKIFSGSLQEFRYYSNEIPEATFNDFVMNPQSIEGNNITGSESSFDIVNFRAPLGNELENTFTSSLSSSYQDPLESVHPAVQGTANILITGSFVNPTGNVTSSTYNIIYYENNTTLTYSKTNTEVYFLDQPSIGFRNRISNKVQVKDGNGYGTILSNRISIQQDYQISQSYTENINNLEVAFSPQDEINDDIIASFGYGVIADTIADPRFISSSDSYYPRLKKVAESYFQKYTEGNAYDYLRLIKYFDNSIFKAIKSYVPARTNVSTGIVIKQHMLERSRFQPVQLSEATTIAITPSGGLNTPIIREDITLTSSISVINQNLPNGGTGGSLTKFNYVGNQFTQQSGPSAGTPHSASFTQTPISQSWDDSINTIVGLETFTRNEQSEFYNGEFSGSEFIATTQSLFFNPYLQYPVVLTEPDLLVFPPNLIILDQQPFIFDYSVYNALLNNVDQNRPNSYRYVVENQFGINTTSNLTQILDGTAEKAQTPNSNYTALKVITPRYLGVKVTSANYNTYAPSGSTSQSFANNTTGSWDGDNVYGKTAAIDKNPIYFAHFQSSKQNYELDGTYTFNVDQIIQVPFEDITENSQTIQPQTIKIDGSNNNLSTVSSTFEKFRNVLVSYQTKFLNFNVTNISSSGTEFTAISSSVVTYLDTLKSEARRIHQGSLEYSTIMTSQPTPITTLSSMSLQIGDNANLNFNSTPPTGLVKGREAIGYSNSPVQTTTTTTPIDFGSTNWMTTGSGYLKLEGPAATLSINLSVNSPLPLISSQVYDGSFLALTHSYNYWIKNQLNARSSGTVPEPPGVQPGIPEGGKILKTQNRNYFRFNTSSSEAGASTLGYTDSNLPFIIERGDEIRVTYNPTELVGTTFNEVQDFVVEGIEDLSATPLNTDILFTSNYSNVTSGIYGTRLFNQINVTPDPSTLAIPIVSGSINSFTIRRRINTDDRVVVFQSPLSVQSMGAQTPTGDGYLIPEDMTDIQKRNVNTLINQLRSNNAVPPNSDNNNSTL